MALPKFTKDVAYISKLADEPNDVGGLSAAALKAQFDLAPQDIQSYINDELIPRIESDIEAAALGVGAGGAVDGETISNGSIGTAKLADGAVTTAKIADRGITTAKLANDAVTAEKIADNAVTGSAVADGSITRNKLADEAVSSDKIFPGAVGNAKIAANAVSADKIADKAITRAKLAAEAWCVPTKLVTTNSNIFDPSDIGVWQVLNGNSTDFEFALNQGTSQGLPNGAEYVVVWLYAKSLKIKGEGVRFAVFGDTAVRTSITVAGTEKFGVVALKKLFGSSGSGDCWLVQGMVEVAT